jgi:hypothetical protein
MKTLNMRWLIAAAALAVAAGSASAQTYKAEIPLSFRAGRATMAPGAYQIQLVASQTNLISVRVHNLDTKRSVLVFAEIDGYTPKALTQSGKPVIAFECTGGTCDLTRLWSGGNGASVFFVKPSHSKHEAQTASVNIELTKAE